MSADKAQLGYATNAELINELQVRWSMGFTSPAYSTMNGHYGQPQPVKCRCGMFDVIEDAEVRLDVMNHSTRACYTVDRHGHPT